MVRIAWQNYVVSGATSLSASSAQSTRPIRWLRDQGRRKTWRSAIGWTVVAGWNDKLDFNEGVTGDATATLTAGTYASGDLLATEVQTRLNAAATDNTYTVTYSSSTNKFTIARATGAASISLEWSTGANAATSCGKDLGYDVSADDTGATSYASDTATYQSRQYILIDFSGAREILLGAVVEHNLGTSSGSIVIGGHATSTALALSSPAATQTLSGAAEGLRILYFASMTYRYWAVVIDARHATEGYTEIGVLYLGGYWTADRGASAGLDKIRKELSAVTFADQGSLYVDKKRRARGWSLEMRHLSDSNVTALEAALDYLGTGRAFIACLEPTTAPTAALYVYLPSAASIRHDPGTTRRWDVSMDLEEAL